MTDVLDKLGKIIDKTNEAIKTVNKVKKLVVKFVEEQIEDETE